MKKYLLSAVFLAASFSLAQEVTPSQNIDKVSRITFNISKKEFAKTEIGNQTQKDIIIKYYEDFKTKTTDEELIKMIDQEIENVKSLPVKTLICFQSKKFSELNLDKKTAKKYEVDNDKFKERTFISPSSTGGSLVYPYLSIDDKTDLACVRMKTTYRSSSWLFTDKMYFILDGEKFEYDFVNPKRDVLSGGYVIETSDVSVDDYLYSFLKKYSTITGREEVRYKGEKGVDDINDVLPKTKERIADMMTLIEQLKK